MIKQKKEELLKLVEQFNQLQKTLQELGNKILRLQGGMRQQQPTLEHRLHLLHLLHQAVQHLLYIKIQANYQ